MTSQPRRKPVAFEVWKFLQTYTFKFVSPEIGFINTDKLKERLNYFYYWKPKGF